MIRFTFIEINLNQGGENVEKIWNNHLLDTSTLCEYSEAMHLLATEIWDKRPKENNRLLWIKKYINEYYFENGLKKIREKDQRRRNFHGLEVNILFLYMTKIQLPILSSYRKKKI